MSVAQNPSGLSPPSAPAKDRPAKPVPERIAEILAVVSILATYSRHLAQTLEQRAVARGFATIARFFGINAFDTILAHLHRGLMRAIALERMLRARAARGRDLVFLAPRAASHRAPPAEAAPDSGQTAAPTPPEVLTPGQDAASRRPPSAGPRRGWPAASPQWSRCRSTPCPAWRRSKPRSAAARSGAQLRRSAAISAFPRCCATACSGTGLFDAIRLYRGSVGSFVLEVKRREQRFEKEDWKHPGLELPEETRDGIRRVLGFLIGEPPINPCAVVAAPEALVAAAATGPP